jgi:metallo-beta-lactamase family protein
VKIFGEVYEVKAEIATIGGLSSHAGQDLLMEYALSANGKLQKVFLVHGEEMPAMILQNKLKNIGIRQVAYPEMHSSAEL